MEGLLFVMISLQVLAVITAAAAGASLPAERHHVPAIYVFGDSTVDVGNNNYLPGENVPRANLPYNGVDFPRSRPTGRFSNGYNIADFVAKSMGFKRSPSAYLSLTPQNNHAILRGLRGVNYASAGAGILDSTNAGVVIPLSKQVQYFADTKAKIEGKLGAKRMHVLLSKSFFLISASSNDLLVFTAQNKSASNNDVATLYNRLLSTYAATITALYKMGARKFGIINIAPIGCVPYARVFYSPTGACVESMNNLAKDFDDHLSALMDDLSSKLEGLSYSIADFYGLIIHTRANPKASGFVNTESACCGEGRLGAASYCMPNSTLCRNRHQYLFWDWVHPTQRFAQLSASAFYDGSPQFTSPVSFKQLITQQI